MPVRRVAGPYWLFRGPRRIQCAALCSYNSRSIGASARGALENLRERVLPSLTSPIGVYKNTKSSDHNRSCSSHERLPSLMHIQMPLGYVQSARQKTPWTIDHKGAIFVETTPVVMFVGNLSTICENCEPPDILRFPSGSLDRICTSCRKLYFFAGYHKPRIWTCLA